MLRLFITAALGFFLTLVAAPGGSAEKAGDKPDPELLRMMEFLKDWEMFKHMEMLKEMQQVRAEGKNDGANPRNSAAPKLKESVK